VLHEVTTTVAAAITTPVGGFLERLDASSMAAARSLGEDSSRARLIMRELLNEDGDQHHVESVVMVIDATCQFLEEGVEAGAWPRQDFKQVVLTMAGIHCFYFAVPNITRRVNGGDPFTTDAVEHRVQAVRLQVRHMLAI